MAGWPALQRRGEELPWPVVRMVALAALIGLIVGLVAQGGGTSEEAQCPEREVEENLRGRIMVRLQQTIGFSGRRRLPRPGGLNCPRGVCIERDG